MNKRLPRNKARIGIRLAYRRDKASRESKSRTPRHRTDQHALRQPAPAEVCLLSPERSRRSPLPGRSSAAAAAGDAPADKRWGRQRPQLGKKKSCRLAGSQGSPRERQTEKGAPQPPQRGRFLGFRWTHICDRWGPSGLGVSPVPGAARAAGVMAGARGAAHDTGGAGQVPPLTGLQQTVVTTAWWGVGVAGREATPHYPGPGSGREDSARSFKKTGSRSEGGGADCDGGCSRWPRARSRLPAQPLQGCRLPSRGVGGNHLGSRNLGPWGPCPRDTDTASFISLWQVDGC